ncbi:MAG: endonuclease III [Actinomycetota bacterium]
MHAPAKAPVKAKPKPNRGSPAHERFPLIYRRLKKEYPDAKCALVFSNPHEMLFATILSAQCTDQMVNKVTEKLFRKYSKIEDYVRADISELEQDIKSTGFFRQKSKNLQASARKLLEEFDGRVPSTMAELTTLPGAARKTANIVLGNSFGKTEGIAVDTHVRRLSQRLGLTSQEDPVRIEQDLMLLVPKPKWFPLSYLFIEHGRKVCKAPTPRCEDCVINGLCPSSRV